jgi:thiamine transport system permease protein
VFLFSFTSFGVVLLLGAPRLATIEVEIYRTAGLLFDLGTAAAMALLQLVGVTALLVWYSRIQESATHRQHLLPAAAVATRPHGRARWIVGAVATVAALISLGPPLALLLRGIGPTSGFGADAIRALGAVDPSVVDPLAAVGNSIGFGVAAVLIALGVAVPAAVLTASNRRMGRWIDPLLMLPIGSSAVTLGFGFVVGLDAPIDLRSWWGLVPVAHALVAIPFVLRTIGPVIRSIEPRLRAAAATLGANPRRVWWTIDLPMVTPAAAAAAALAFAVSLGEFGATLFIARPGGQTMTLAIFRLLGRPGELNLSAALGMSVVLIAVTAGAVALIERVRAPGLGGF